MKRIIMFVLLFAALKVAGQTTGYLRFDTVKIMKQNGSCELYIINKTKDSLGLLTNVGGGLTQFKRARAINDSSIIIGNDTIVIRGATSVTASNGLTKTGSDIKLGGALTQSTTIPVGTNELEISAANGTTSSTKITIDNTNAIIGGRYEDFSSVNNVYVNPDNIQIISSQPIGARRILIDSTTGIRIQENVSGIYSGLIIKKTTGQVQLNGYTPGAFEVLDTTTYKPLSIDASGNVNKMSFWPGSGADSSLLSTNYRRDTAVANLRVEIGTKLNISDTANKWINDIRRSNDSVFALKNGTWQFKYIDSTGGGSSQNLRLDLPWLSETKIYSPAKGVASSQNVTNYSHTSLDSARYKFSTTRAGVSGSEYGGWLAPSTSGDSIRVTAPFWVIIGDSQAEGHPGLHGRMHTLPSGLFQWNYPDSVGQLSYHLRYLTNMHWYNQGIGGQTTEQVRVRFYRDVLAETYPGTTTTQTLTRRPQGVVIIVGINDVFNGISAATTKANLEWMASVCQQYGIRCVILNLPGDEISGQTELRKISEINNWLAGGVMDQYGACVVDYNSWWNDPAYGNDNVHNKTAYIGDDIHPSKVGYDSLANYIYREAKLPKLTKALFINELDPGGFTGYSRPAGITINATPYTLSAATELINITSYVPDSVWIKITSSTNITGTSYSGFSHIEWYTTNNPNDSTYYTKRTLYSGSVTANQNVSGIKLIDPIIRTSGQGFPIFDVRLNDTTLRAFQVYTSGGGGTVIVNGLTNTTPINNGTFNVYGSIGSNSNVLADGTSHKFGQLQILSNAKASTSGFGISGNNTIAGMDYQSTAAGGKPSHLFSYWNNATTTTLGSVASSVTSIIATPIGFGNAGNTDQVGNVLSLTPTYNNTSSQTGTEFRGIYYRPIITSLTNTRHVGMYLASGNNYINVGGVDSTCFGCDSASAISAKFRVKGTTRFDLGSDADYDMHYRAATTGLQARLPIGTALYNLRVNSSATGYEWADATRTIDVQYTTAVNSGTSETDLFTKTVAANTLTANGQTLNFEIDGEVNDNTATATIKLYFAGNTTLNTGAVNISTAATAWKISGKIVRTSPTTAHVTYEMHAPGLATTYFLGYSNLTSLDFTTTNIFKVTAQAGGAGGGTGDITAHSWQILYKPQ